MLIKECLKDLVSTVDGVSETVNSILAEQKAITARVVSVEKRVDELENGTTFIDKEVTNVKSRLAELEKHVGQLHRELSVANEKITSNGNAQLNLERYSRNYNLRFGGIPEQSGEDCENVIRSLIKDKFSIPDIAIDNAHRTLVVSKSRDSSRTSPRHIIVKFPLRLQRRKILSMRQEVLKNTSILVQVDLCPADYNIKRSYRDVMNIAYKDGKRVRFHNGRLYINDKEYVKPGT
uniref:LINE-1 type transposase domain-containing protein 1-like n=1 Tax=Saccoglossus kowalevskii TaxID=10224 RepID=A0ABM0N0A4_SACKO|nr:PREDICTED: LINE-1 type transposase domain-containing protein 1-like [Saccoglossus kowalevskii]